MRSRRTLCLFTVGAALALWPARLRAQNSIVWTTNYYAVTGASFREIRQSMAASRPWKDGFDGDTRWNLEWKYNVAQSANGCLCSSVSTVTKIVTTLPHWTPPPGVEPEVTQQWTNYFVPLAQHEAGHASLGIAAAAEVRKSLAGIAAQPDCDRLKKLVNERAERVVEDYRAREREYDRRTGHGTKPAGAP